MAKSKKQTKRTPPATERPRHPKARKIGQGPYLWCPNCPAVIEKPRKKGIYKCPMCQNPYYYSK